MDQDPPTPELIDPVRLSRRRATLYSATFLLTSLATWFMADVLWKDGGIHGFEWAVLALFIILFAHIAIGFVTAMMGFYVINRGGDSQRLLRPGAVQKDDPLAGTAVIMPVFNEDVSRVFEGLRAIYESTKATGKLEHFDFFILSDSNKPNQWIQEEVAWLEFCKQVDGFGHVFYRKRRHQINKKAGNVADFLRRWGKRYRYMIVLDADSIMTGDAMVTMVQLMEKHPHVGLIQTAPRLVRGESMYARIQQFANRLYSPLFLTGLNYWQQHEGNYWGHNAIIRIKPFIEHCSLPELPGSEPFGGRILSHDFVEAALMRRAGWSVWLAPEIAGTYEEGPPSVIDNAKRDRRWCQGNMQHAWLLTAKGFRAANRFHLFMGIMGYVASPLWLIFLILSTAAVLNGRGFIRNDENNGDIHANLLGFNLNISSGLFLFFFTMALLFLPKLAALTVALSDNEKAKAFGGRLKLLGSTAIEILVSMLLAPINMLFQSKFVLFTLLGQGVSWVSQRRQAGGDNAWREAILTHGGQTLLGAFWGLCAYIISPPFFWWLSPVIVGLVFSIPLSILLGDPATGLLLKTQKWLLVPEESAPPPELSRLETNLELCHRHMQPIEELREDYGLLQAVLDPYINALHVSLLRQRRPSEDARDWLNQLRRKLLWDGPSALSQREKLALLLDAESMIWLHEELWRQPSGSVAEWWRLGMRQYNVLTSAPDTALYR